ncbi:hypothetical protein EMPG_13280 [Blastomyces silverae]|uniref:GATA-type domain-containing protein n=1 Tax=Blastomyces silverae TaxID=2060906 RepID=A0A0H1BJK4_9EURO|nr:hypothetical protein EMPG_13280 [Blastomyces silverae]
MWSCSDTEPEEDDTTARRCSYCGRFGSSKSIVEETGLCHKCHENVHSLSKDDVASLRTGKNGGGPSSVAAAVMLQMAAVDVNDDSSSIRSITSIHSDQEDDEEEEEEEDGNSSGDGNEIEKRRHDDRKLRGSGRNVSSNTGTESNLCARCWKTPSTTILYNTPICNECYRIAQEKREHTKGTKKIDDQTTKSTPDNQKRFQPPTPHLQPGKRLTRVCDSCRRKRKRCQHRRVVDENDPDADLRRKRSRKERTSAVTSNRAGRSSTSSSSVIEVNDTVIVSETEQGPMATPSARTSTTTTTTTNTMTTTGTGTGTCTVKTSTTPTNGALPAKATTTDSPLSPTARNRDDYSASNLRRAIEGSVHVVFSREMDRLVGTAEKKLADAASALDDVKAHMTAWLGGVKGDQG